MKMLNQEVALPRAISEEGAHLVECLGFDLSPFRSRSGFALARARMIRRVGVRPGDNGQVVGAYKAQDAPPRAPPRLSPMKAGISPKTPTMARNTRPLGRASPAMYSDTERPRIQRALMTSAASTRDVATTPMPSR